eukprot:654664-Rhodomonas_salina.1
MPCLTLARSDRMGGPEARASRSYSTCCPARLLLALQDDASRLRVVSPMTPPSPRALTIHTHTHTHLALCPRQREADASGLRAPRQRERGGGAGRGSPVRQTL